MRKNYTIQPLALFSFLLLLNLTVSAQSKSGKFSNRPDNFLAKTASHNVARGVPSTNPVMQATETVTACGTYTWPVNNQTYTNSGIYTFGGGITQQFNDITAWNTSASNNGATVAFEDLAGIPETTTINITVGATSVSFSAPGGMYSNGVFLGTKNSNEAITITFNPPIYGLAGNFFTTDINDAVITGNITATHSDAHVDSRTVSTNTESFGYFSTTPLTSVTVSSSTAGSFVSLRNLSIATNPTADDVLDLTILPIVTPTFPAVSPICEGTPLTPFQTTSNNGITGTWAPALDNINTTTYTFTPDSGQCATSPTATITVFPFGANTTTMVACNSYTWPITGQTYTTSGQYVTTIPLTDTAVINDLNTWAQHAFSFNSEVYLADVSTIPATNPTVFTMGSTTIVMSAPGGMYGGIDFLGTANPNNPMTITFTPPVYGVSANFFTTDVDDNIIPGNVTVTYSNGHVESRTVSTDTDTFGYFDNNSIASIVLSSTTTVPNHFVSLKNLAIASNPTSCSTETLDLTINDTVPTGDTIATPIEVNTPTYSVTGNNLSSSCFTDNGGELSPDVWYKINLSACAQTISMNTCTGTNFDTIITVYAADGVTELAYSDDDCGSSRQSAITDLDVSGQDFIYLMVEGYYGLGEEEGTYGLQITQSLLTPTDPIFQPVAGICRGDALDPLPTTSDNGIPGTWSPALDNTVTTEYTFTPDLEYCASTATLTIDVTQPTIPTFTAVADICNGGTLTALPTLSNNGYTGTWSPALNNTLTTEYTFTPDPGQCAAQATLTITVNQPVTPTFTAVADICNGDALSALPTTSINGYNGTWSPAINNTATTTYTFTPTTGQCATSASMTITVNQPITPTFTAIADICNGDTLTLPATSNNGYSGTWSPAINNTATTTYTFTPTAGQCATTASLTVTVIQPTTPTFTAVPAICNGDTLSPLPTLSNNGYTGTWSPAINNTITTTYTFTPNAGQCASATTLTITVNQPVTPSFTAVPAICNGDALSALPTLSNNGYTGNWSPALDNTITTIYTFTPTVGQCASPTTLTITVNQPITPTFTAVADICNGDTLAALPTTSINGYNGTWSPAINNTASTTYTFTPNAGQCATSASLTITVNQPVTPTFTAVADICNGDTLAALPTTSINGYNGTWSPAINNTATTTYTFTPTAGQCATSASMTITVNQPITPTFTAVPAICNGDALSALPTTSNNNYTGSWSPAIDNTLTTLYTFTPTAGQCATSASLTITVNQPVTPTFDAVAAICNGDSLSALPTLSNNGYTGTWSPALNNALTTEYTFTPDPGQCASETTLTITVNQPVTPTFSAITICNGDALTLPTTSINGYNGTWSPIVDNTTTATYTFTPIAGQCATTATLTVNVDQPVTPLFAAIDPICNGEALVLPTISTNGYSGIWSPIADNTTTKTYTFTPTAGQCATTATMTVTVNQPITPTFTAIADICNGDALSLPTTSLNGYAGTWSPAVNNTATTTYTFTPTAGQCATTASMTITVIQPTIPTFTAVTPICNGDALTALPTTSNNNYTGSWSPVLDNTITTEYTFTPDPGQCASVTTLTITVNQPITPTFTAVAPICSGGTLSALPTTSNNNYTGTWSPALDNTLTTEYTFTPDAGQCAALATLTITVNQPSITPTFTAIADICNGDALTLQTTSNNGISGSWSPAVDNTATTTYTFTPNPGQCGIPTDLTVVVNQPITPTFNAIDPICNGDALVLPTTSVDGISGTWSPAANNTATTTYTFTPDSGECANSTSMTVVVNQPTTPTFTAIADICNGDAFTLPTTSLNGYAGTWSPAINNIATTTYTFTPTAGQCATTASMTVNVIQPTIPTFTAVAPICNGDALSALPTTSNNNYTGSWSPALDNTLTTQYTFTPDPGQCASVTTLTITVNQPVTPTFTAVAPICNGGTLAALPTTSNNNYTGTWSPALDNTLTTEYTFTPDAGQCAALATLTITVNQPTTVPTFDTIAPICNGESLTLPVTSTNGITGVWSPAFDNTATATYTFTPNPGQCGIPTTLTVTVNQPVTPVFDPIAAICNGDALTLPTTSVDGISGTWLPAIDNTVTTTYTFTPDSGECATTTTLSVTVNQPVTPTFTVVAPICNGDTLSALPTLSDNGYTGTWSPALDNTLTTEYTFTPDAGQCASTATLTITVNQPVAATFTAVAPICNGESLTALPTLSNNGFTGTWSPALDNTLTTEYTFTPDSGQCAAAATLTITVNQPVTPTFTAVAPICNGDALSALPTLSNNGYSGTWSPALDNTLTTEYTFTPDAGQCAASATLTIVVNEPVTPTFTAIAAICNGDSLTLPTTSNNGISGTWSPAVDNTITTTYTFTPDSGQCALDTTLTVTVNQPVAPIFTPIADICSGDALILPTLSDNGYLGTWSPTLNNTATTTYTFTPDAGQCASTATLTVNVIQPTVPTFDAVAAICNGESLSALPTTSNNGYEGTWSPALNNTATTTYTFTPDAGQCAAPTTLTITVNQPVTPTFTAVDAICNGETLSALPTLSNNGFTGSWSPALDNTQTTEYTFTPDAGQCAASTTLTITVNQPTTVPTFDAIDSICNGAALVLPVTSNNGISGTWSPAVNNTATTTYTFTPDAGQCGVTTTLEVIVNDPVTPTFAPLGPICSGDMIFNLPETSSNGIIGTWSPAENNTETTTYTFTPNSGECATSTTLTVVVIEPVTPTFSSVAAICNGETLTALPTVSNNSYSGTWSPALNNTATTTYTFTPNPGQCATTANLTITVNQPETPTFTPVAAICNGDALTALPTLSNNGYAGTWSPALNNTATTTYTFTPDAGQCAATTTLTIEVHTTPTPTGNSTQSFTVADLNDATLEDLVVSPTDVNWYGSLADAISLNNPPLPLSTVLTDGATYYAVSFSGTCPSQPFAVTVTVTLDNEGFDNLHFNYYPNPTSSVINISYSKEITELTLMNMLGQIISTEKTNATEVQVDLSRLPEATYLIKVAVDNKEKIIKVIKQR